MSTEKMIEALEVLAKELANNGREFPDAALIESAIKKIQNMDKDLKSAQSYSKIAENVAKSRETLANNLMADLKNLRSDFKSARESLNTLQEQYLEAADMAVRCYPYTLPNVPTEYPTTSDYTVSHIERIADKIKKERAVSQSS